MKLEDFHAQVNAETITPTITATARSCQTVTAVTRIITKASPFGTLRIILKEVHAKVPTTTIIIMPTRAAMGIISIQLDKNNIKDKSDKAATIPDNLPLPPEEILIID